MKKILLAISFLLASYNMIGQIDRSKLPQSAEAPAINISTPTTYKLDNGLTIMVVENHKLPRISMRLVMNRPPNNVGNKAGLSGLTSALMGNGSKQVPKDYFNEMIEFLGARVNLSPNSGSVSSLSRYFERVFELFADAALNPNFTQEELDKERQKQLESLKSGENSPQRVASVVGGALVYTQNHPYGNFRTAESLNSITLDDIKQYYQENFLPENAYMIFIGDIKSLEAKQLVEKYFANWTGKTKEQSPLYVPQDVEQTQINLVDMPNAVQSELNVFNLQDLKMADEDLFPVLVMNYILGGSFGSYINMNLREKHGFTYGANSSVGVDKWTRAEFSVSTKVRNEVTARAIEEVLKEIQRIQNQDVDEEKLAQAKAQYLGGFILSTESPSTMASFALNIITENLPADFYKNYIKNIQAVTVADVKRVANKYIKSDKLRIVVVGKQSEILTDLQGLNIPIRFFDKQANELK